MSRLKAFIYLVFVVAIGSGLSVRAADYVEGFEYHKVTPPQATVSKDKIEVVEMFWYGCPHCYRFEPLLHEWLKNKPDNVEFVRMPAIFRPNWELHAKAFYTAEALGVLDRIHKPLFDAIHKHKQKLDSVAALRTFFKSYGVKAEDFDKTIASFAVLTKVQRAKRLSRAYGIHGVPSMIVNGKYMTDAKFASLGDSGGNSQKKMLQVVEYLIKKEAAATTAASKAKK
jgi:thiol:disulfide interchange protein DsbA